MLPEARDLLDALHSARLALVSEVDSISLEQAYFQLEPQSWSVSQVVEHLVWAEFSGLNKMMVALEAWRSGKPVWSGENPNEGQRIEDVIERTWKPKETAPSVAEPRMGGPLPFWLASFRSCQSVAEDVAERIQEDELDSVIFPHFLSGPLTMRQRLEFLRYHIDHHRPQVERIKAHPKFP